MPEHGGSDQWLGDGNVSVLRAVVWTLVLNAVVFGLLLGLMDLTLAIRFSLLAPAVVPLLLLFGLTQLLYLGPAIVLAQRSGRIHWMQGILIGAAVTVMLNGACWALARF